MPRLKIKDRAHRNQMRPALEMAKLQVGVTRSQHRGKTRGFFLAPALFTRLFEMPVIAHDLEGSFAVNFFLQSPQRAFHGFAFF
jgi:hypothetical protein